MQGFSPFSRPKTVNDMLSEIESYMNYFTDLGEEMSAYKGKLTEFVNKLNSIISKTK